jgi:hypothetical protein
MEDRQQIAASLGSLLTVFTGDHVGEPRLLGCPYEVTPPLHVDLGLLSQTSKPDFQARLPSQTSKPDF